MRYVAGYAKTEVFDGSFVVRGQHLRVVMDEGNNTGLFGVVDFSTVYIQCGVRGACRFVDIPAGYK